MNKCKCEDKEGKPNGLCCLCGLSCKEATIFFKKGEHRDGHVVHKKCADDLINKQSYA